MPRNLLPVLALLLGTLFLFFGNGLHGLLLPVRGTHEGYSNEMLGLLGTSWASGFVLGCFLAPALIRRIGHARAFSVFTALIAIVALITGVIVDDIVWVALRAATGFCIAGTSMIIESWLNERATNESRGTIFSFYIAITLIGVVGGQMTLALGDATTQTLFLACGIFYCLAILPTTLSNAATPQPLKAVKLDLPALYRTSPIACFGILLIGIANGAYGTLGAVFGARAGLSQSSVALMMSLTIFAGALAQFPAGRLSDRVDRRLVLAGLSGVAALAGLLVVVTHPFEALHLIPLIIFYGAAANALYPIAVAHANDFAAPEDFVKVSGGLLLLFGIGTIIGPTIGGPIMTLYGPHYLFAVTASAHLAIALYAIFRSRMRAPVPVADRESYATMPMGTTPVSTPEASALDPRATAEDISPEGQPEAAPAEQEGERP
ncbi:MFS transporter [Allorhizobium borbori]|jgi:MFS family permease|uniref:MFS family permease n=1 Tax=Allorhizobium borbori TaxID=485907 RepID=A0A7W6K0N3_9HYPH|nr:MFS transporter [Allorhizobium borbori]MBB4102046.1 MFS family permease [Allorhizobium borbori]PZU20538.1 MAG: MFS transporter [Shinella sp.]